MGTFSIYITVFTCAYILLLPSDGSAAQYKYFKNFATIHHHSDDFRLDCEWNFFVTSHGKNTCDGTGGTVKPKCKSLQFYLKQKNLVFLQPQLNSNAMFIKVTKY